ncbi:hypothetical protein Gohar_025071 [Gossypium harknessii]|uniref:Uncharacterized protein n=1 Tax=Gossypium harknessii TaxID=34285 RepID=A0A7J9HIF1_9ROSI|nr:hypothetical protein [Gossypium harknessii]MBA0809418.1 hypothetical protein [Gossypium harknessii]
MNRQRAISKRLACESNVYSTHSEYGCRFHGSIRKKCSSWFENL